MKIKSIISSLLLAMLLFVGSTGTAEAQRQPGTIRNDEDVTLCHATNAHNNPYNQNTVSKRSIMNVPNGHDTHNGVVWQPGVADHSWGDIIPAFTYSVWEQTGTQQNEISPAHFEHRHWVPTTYKCPTANSAFGDWDLGKTCRKGSNIFNYRWAYPVVDVEGHWSDWEDGFELFADNRWVDATYETVPTFGWVDHAYAGKNLSTEGLAILNNSCEIPVIDLCQDINGIQETVPADRYQDGVNCPARTQVCTDPLANNDVAQVGSTEIANPAACRYDNRPICTAGETVQLPVNVELPVGSTEGACEVVIVDLCLNLPEVQTVVPEGYTQVGENCIADEEPEATPSASPVPTPAPGKSSGLEITALSCDNRNFDVIIDLKDGTTAAAGVKVKFTYNGKVIEATTDASGKARAGYHYEGDMAVKVEPENGFAGHDRHVELPKDLICAAGVGGPSVGEVLGASTMAETGVIEDMFFSGIGSLGGMLTMVGSVLYGKKKRA